MAKISALKLDPETRDLCFDADGIMEVVEDGNAIAQNIRNNLLTWKGEFPLNTGHGTGQSAKPRTKPTTCCGPLSSKSPM